MAAVKTLLTVLYLLVYSGFSTADMTVTQVTQVEKGVTLTKEILEGLDTLSKEVKDKASDSVSKVLKVFGYLGKVAASFGFIGALVSFIFSFIPQSNPMFVFMKEQFAEVNRKLDSLARQISALQTQMEWTSYASSYSKDENVIRNSWAKLTEFINEAPLASTPQQKTRLAERFTNFYENVGGENSVANLYTYITENNPNSLNQNLLKLIVEKSNGDFSVLAQFSTYLTTLMISGLKLNMYYYLLKGYDSQAKAKEAVTRLSNSLSAIQDALIECADGVEKWAYKDVEILGTQKFSSSQTLVSNVKKHLERKFHWFKWRVLAHPIDAQYEYTYGPSINIVVQDKTSIHLVYQDKASAVDQSIKNRIQSAQEIMSLRSDQACPRMNNELLHRLGAKVTSHIQFLHASQPYEHAQSDEPDIKFGCLNDKLLIRDFYILLKANSVAKLPCAGVKCNHGECKPIKDTTQVLCKCDKMFNGPNCEENIQHIIDYAVLEDRVNGMAFKPVPDLTAIYYSIEELRDYTGKIVESLRHDIQWTQIMVKYGSVIQKFHYIDKLHSLFKNTTITELQYTSEVGAQFTGGETFQFLLSNFHHMMTGAGFGERQNLLDFVRSSSKDICTQSYSGQMDYFVRYMFALEKEAVLAWCKYSLAIGKPENVDFVQKLFQNYASQQWKLFNKNGCGPLKAADLQNSHCKELYHSSGLKNVQLTCSGSLKSFPEAVSCTGGKWSALPVCYAEQENGHVQCKYEGGETHCVAVCSRGWGSASHPRPAVYKCSQSPCPTFKPHRCVNCTASSVCKNNEVCTRTYGTCRDACLVKPCGVNARCSSSNHGRTCTCVSPWKGNPDHGCRSQDLQWVQTGGVPSNAVRSESNLVVCKGIGPDGGWHSGFLDGRYCKYEYGWGDKWASSYKVLVDPCQGRGWKWVKGIQDNSVWYDKAKGWGVTMYVCSAKNIVGKLFNTRNGFMCHIPKYNDQRHGSFYSLVTQPCV